MTEMFTPEPWEAYNLNKSGIFPSVYIGPPDNNGRRAKIHINEGPSPEMIEAGRNFGTTIETARANACLIASAPDLLAALQAVEWVSVDVGYGKTDHACPRCDRLRSTGHADDCQIGAAIAKASGQTENEPDCRECRYRGPTQTPDAWTCQYYGAEECAFEFGDMLIKDEGE